MRRKTAIILCVLAVLFLLCSAEQKLIEGMTDKAQTETNAILTEIRAGRFEQAKEKAHALDQAWDRDALVLEVLVNHCSTDEVRYALSRLLASLESEDRAAALIYCCELEGAVEHVRERQMLTMENLF